MSLTGFNNKTKESILLLDIVGEKLEKKLSWIFLIVVIFAMIPSKGISKVKNVVKTEVILLGVLHDHSKSPKFSHALLKNILVNVKPDIILIELPLNWFITNKPTTRTIKKIKQTRKESEFKATWKYCQKYKVPCLPFDVRNRNQYYKKTKYFYKEKRFYQQFFQRLKTKLPLLYKAVWNNFHLVGECASDTPQTINSSTCDRVVKTKHDYLFEVQKSLLEKGKFKGLAHRNFFMTARKYWVGRNNAMIQNICTIAQQNHTKRILVAVGFEHRYYLKKIAKSCRGIVLREYYQFEKR